MGILTAYASSVPVSFDDRAGVAELLETSAGIASPVGIIVPPGAQVAGRMLRDIGVPKEYVVAAIVRGKQFVVPRGDTTVQEGDHVVFVGPTGAIKAAHDSFALTTS